MRLLATLMLVLVFALVRPLAGQAEGLGPCTGAPAAEAAHDMATAHDMMHHAMTDHAMMGHDPMHHHAPARSAPVKPLQHTGCASACCASPAVLPEMASEPVMTPLPALLIAAATRTATPVPHAPDLRPPIA